MWYNITHVIGNSHGIRKRIEVVITGLTRNQFAGNGTWVRIPPLPLKSRQF